MKTKGVFIFLSTYLLPIIAFAQLDTLIPDATATHIAVQDGSWFDQNTWDINGIPTKGAIVLIPEGRTVMYNDYSEEHIFAVKVKGIFRILPSQSIYPTTLYIDTYVGTMMSNTMIVSNSSNSERINMIFKPFDIEGHKTNPSEGSSIWSPSAVDFYSDGDPVFKVERSLIGPRRYKTYEDAIAGSNYVEVGPEIPYDDGFGVLGRYRWDPSQLSLGLVTMGQITVDGVEKSTKVKLGADAFKGEKTVELQSAPTNWEVGDTIIITRGGNHDTPSNGEDEAVIETINGNMITTKKKLRKNHFGRPQDTLHCYVGNLTRNIEFRSASTEFATQRAHLMAMHNDTHIEIKNAKFRNIGRTNKDEIADDLVWKQWLAPKTFKSKISALGQEIAELEENPINQITNRRGRYAIHLHRTGVSATTNLASVKGNVVWGNIGWGITQHHSYANISNNVVYDITGSGIVSESGAELGTWNNNLVVKVRKGYNGDVYYSAIVHNDYLFGGQGLGMKGRGVICNDNVIANAVFGVGVMNMSPSYTGLDRVDPVALSSLREGFEIDQFPLDKNGYSKEGDGIIPTEISLIMRNTTNIWCNQGLRSIEREMGVNHESRSIFDNYVVWGASQALSITYQADYSFRDVFLSGKDPSSSKGLYIWKHSHNHVFDGIKIVDMKNAMTVSKLVEAGTGVLKTRNNGFTPWYFIDLEMENVQKMYEITFDDPATVAVYDQHGDNPIHMQGEEFVPRNTTFTILDSSEMAVDLATGDLRFLVDGFITDDLGSYNMGIKQAPAQLDLRLDYPERIYEFASNEKLEEYVAANGVYKYDGTDQHYFIIDEILPNRRSWEYTSFPIRINIMNPSSIMQANALIESEDDLKPTEQLWSRRASVSQSSTQSDIVYKDSLIDVSAYKAIDGSNNGRIGVNYYQDGLVPIGSFSQTEMENEPWYDLDLGAPIEISYIDIWNTVELNGEYLEPNSDHFKNFYVLISDEPFGNATLSEAMAIAHTSFYKDDSSISRKWSINVVNATGQYVRIQAEGINKMKLAEVEIVGIENSKCGVVLNTNDSGEGSLRANIECAMPGDTITFAESIFGDTINITSTKLIIDKELTIKSEVSEGVVLRCMISVGSGASTLEITSEGNVVTLIGFTIVGCDDGQGVAINNFGQLILEGMNLKVLEGTSPESVYHNHLESGLLIRNVVRMD